MNISSEQAKKILNESELGDIKIIKQVIDYTALWRKGTEESLKREMELQILLWKNNLAPKPVQLLLCKEGGIILMEEDLISISSLLKTLSHRQVREGLSDFGVQIQKRCLGIKEIEDVIHNHRGLQIVKDIINRLSGDYVIRDINVNKSDNDNVKEFRLECLVQIFDLLKKLNALEYEHGDVNLDNFVMDKKGNIRMVGFEKSRSKNFDSLIDDMNGITAHLQRLIDDGLYNLQYLHNYADSYITSLYSFKRPTPVDISEFESTQPENFSPFEENTESQSIMEFDIEI
jgi:hypothetical protein